MPPVLNKALATITEIFSVEGATGAELQQRQRGGRCEIPFSMSLIALGRAMLFRSVVGSQHASHYASTSVTVLCCPPLLVFP